MNKAEKIAVQEWVALHRCCAVCWWPESDLRRRLEVHHLIGGAGRKHDIRNYLSLCERCHGILHSGKVYSGLPDVDRRILLTAKQESDPENYDPAFLASLKHKKHLGYEPEPIPEYYLEERQRNVAGWKYRKP
jgi:hypothetical protein